MDRQPTRLVDATDYETKIRRFYDRVDADFYIGYLAQGNAETVGPAGIVTRAGRWTDEWGTEWGHVAGGVAASPVTYPLADWTELDHCLATRLPEARALRRLRRATEQLDAFGRTRCAPACSFPMTACTSSTRYPVWRVLCVVCGTSGHGFKLSPAMS